MTMRVDFYRHGIEPKAAADAVSSVFATPFLTSGEVGRRVEQQLASYFGTSRAALVNSWTNGALATLLALGIGPEDEVIVPAMTFIASVNIIELLGARPVFVDVDPDTLLMTAEGLRRALTQRTRVVIPVHLYGQMVDIKMLRTTLGGRDEVAIVEDAAHCFEGEYEGQKPGKFSNAAIFSFYATKNVTCGEGGAIITNDVHLYQSILKTRLHGMSAGAIDRFQGNKYHHWDMDRLGVKANLPDILASVLPPQIATIDRRLKIREGIACRYERALRETPIRFLRSQKAIKHARHLFVIHVPPEVRDEALSILSAHNIGCTVNFRSVPTMTYYRKKYRFRPDDFPISYKWGEGTISLPFFPTLTNEELDYVINVLQKRIVPLVEKSLVSKNR